MTKSVVLLSAGLDSTVNLFVAHQKTQILCVLTFDYGQRAAAKEIERAKKMCHRLDLKHEVLDLTFFKKFTSTSLINTAAAIPQRQEVNIHEPSVSQQTAERVWVPNRNGIFLNIAAGFAEGLGAQVVVPGFNAEEAQTFPDNSVAYIEAVEKSFVYSTLGRVQVKCFTQDLQKTEIVKWGLQLGVDFKNDIWPCYFDGSETQDHWCGQCESCQRFLQAYKNAGGAL